MGSVSSPKIAAVLFDYGMVLSGPPHPEAWAAMLRTTGLTQDVFDAGYWASRPEYDRGGLTAQQYWLAVGAHGGLSLTERQVVELIAADNQLWTQPNPPMIAWVHRLHAAGTPTGILSNLGDAMTDGVLAAFPWLTRFTHLLFSHRVKVIKPDPAIYRHAMEGLGVAAGEILFVDDREENLAGARAAGMQAIRYTQQEAFEREMAERGLGDLWRTGRLF